MRVHVFSGTVQELSEDSTADLAGGIPSDLSVLGGNPKARGKSCGPRRRLVPAFHRRVGMRVMNPIAALAQDAPAQRPAQVTTREELNHSLSALLCVLADRD